jgi:hypothetical protein
MNLLKLTRSLRPTLVKQFPRMPPQIALGGGSQPPRIPTGPDIEWEPIEQQKPMQIVEYTRERRDWSEGDTAEPEKVIKDISGCSLAFNMACLKLYRSISDKIEERQGEGKTLSTTDRLELKEEMEEGLAQAQEDFRKCLVKGKSMMSAMYDEFVKTAEETAQDQIKSVLKSVTQLKSGE